MQTKALKKMTLKLDALRVQSMVMPAAAPIRAVTTSETCPTKCDTLEVCSRAECPPNYSEPGEVCQTYEWGC
jgi:hypothetical protein